MDKTTFKPKIKVDEYVFNKIAPIQYTYTQFDKIEPPKITEMYKNKGVLGTYNCVVCDVSLFDSSAKYKTNTGYPSFHTAGGNVYTMPEITTEYNGKKNQMARNWLKCLNCGANLGVVYADTKSKTNLRYSINSLSLTFRPDVTLDYGAER